MKKICIPLLLVANICFAQVDLNLGLKAYYPFSGNANDVSGNNNNPVFNNATLTADRFGNPNSAYHFNGTNTYMQVPNNATLNMGNTMSIALWVKPTGYYTGPCYNNMCVMKSNPTTLPSNYFIRFADVYNGCTAPSTTEERFAGNTVVAATPFVQLNQWYSVVWTSDGITERIYVNCVLRSTAPAGGVPYTNISDLLMGKNVDPAFPYWLNGDLDEIRIYDRALNQDEVNTLGGCITPTSCNNWLFTPNNPSSLTVGDLDVTGNQLTVEVTYNRTVPFNSGLYPGHLVSKHTDVSNVNYSLFPNGCAVTTTNGYKSTFETCGLGLNKTYHVAMVYDGSFLKFYRNGFLLSQVACTGNLVTNNLLTTIAQYTGGGFDQQFMGYVNEVRIWNIARTQAQLQTYMNSSLPNPTTIPGLLGYYTFDNLLNKQGNAAFNATLNGSSTINATNPNCTFVADSCVVPGNCNNWLRTQAVGQRVTVGDLDISGNQMTVEANFNCTSFPISRPDKWEDIVSKHSGTNDANYVLRMDLAAITTTNGHYLTPPPCDNLALNKTYHVALVYDGINLKLYRNGFLISQIAATGNLVVNDLLTSIGDYAVNNPVGTNFFGYINEVRIWNVARTQVQLRTYMDASLPNPTTQTGLQGYYIFDNLLNKQGNAAFNGTLLGGATINNTNPNCTFVADSCLVPVSCNNWLSTPTHPSTASIGNLNVTGNQITVETNFNCTSYTSSGLGFGGKLIGKHTNAANTCYALSPHAAEISTSNNGYVVTYDNCPFELNKTYHVAMVYDGTSLKFYRNGFLMSQIPCSGNISTNSLLASIGNGPNSPLITQFYGYINEMRIWNVARTQAQIQTYMNSSLPNPTTQSGLLAYYTFDNLLNKQGNTAYNGTLNGGATINNVNPNCTFVADSCTTTGTSIIINDYTPVLALTICDNKLTVEDGTRFNAGDTVLLIQMKGAIIDSTNTAAFGTITDYKNAGNYEFNYVKSKTGNIIELSNALTRQYDIPVGKVQLIKVPYFTSLSTTDTITCLPWDGNKGGVLVLNVRDSINLNTDINVSGKGFKGSQPITNIPPATLYNQIDYAYPSNVVDGSRKGEGIAEVSENLIFCRGPLASGGGGANSHNAGGGGGGNGGAGGRGGNEWGGSAIVLTNGGIGGKNYVYSATNNKIFMGGAGGAGHANDGSGTAGGNGGGIAIINTNKLIPNSFKIVSNGLQGADCSNIITCADGVGGGGSGGTIVINTQTIASNFQVQTNGGKGADNNINGPNATGPGGGGGGGSLLVNAGTLLANITYSATGGIAGRALNQGNTNWGALPGSNGISSANFIIPISTVPFKKNIDSVRIKDSLMICRSIDFKGLAYINSNPVSAWQWYFGDGGTANTQNTTHTYINAGIYAVKLVVTDINGCKDSIVKNITLTPFTANAGNDTTICSGSPASVVLHASAGASFAWTPVAFLNNPALQNPVATITGTTKFYVTITNAQGCTAMDSVTVTLATAPANTRYPTVTALTYQSVQLQARNLGGNSYIWLPAVGLNNNLIINPIFSHNQSQEYKINILTASGCPVVDTLLITLKGTKGIYVPKAFSPNGDGTNDRLYPILVGIRQLNYFRVFNRWGNLVFETKSDNPAAGWDGRINGFPQPPETFTWTAEGIDIDGITIKKSGNTFLIR